MEPSGKIPDIHEIAVDAAPLDEGTLAVGEQAYEEDIGDYFIDVMDKADGLIVRDALRTLLFGQEHEVGRVEPLNIGGAYSELKH